MTDQPENIAMVKSPAPTDQPEPTADIAETARATVHNSGNGATPPDPFADPSQFVVSQDFARQAGVKKLLTTVPVRKPNKHDFVRVHPEHRMSPVGLLELREERETYLVMPHMASELSGAIRYATLYLAINRQGVPFIWPAALPEEGGRRNQWSLSAHNAAALAEHHWLRLQANMSLGAYEVVQAEAMVAEPEWPDLPFGEVLRIAFRDFIIDGAHHPAVRRLRGLE